MQQALHNKPVKNYHHTFPPVNAAKSFSDRCSCLITEQRIFSQLGKIMLTNIYNRYYAIFAILESWAKIAI